MLCCVQVSHMQLPSIWGSWLTYWIQWGAYGDYFFSNLVLSLCFAYIWLLFQGGNVHLANTNTFSCPILNTQSCTNLFSLWGLNLYWIKICFKILKQSTFISIWDVIYRYLFHSVFYFVVTTAGKRRASQHFAMLDHKLGYQNKSLLNIDYVEPSAQLQCERFDPSCFVQCPLHTCLYHCTQTRRAHLDRDLMSAKWMEWLITKISAEIFDRPD